MCVSWAFVALEAGAWKVGVILVLGSFKCLLHDWLNRRLCFGLLQYGQCPRCVCLDACIHLGAGYVCPGVSYLSVDGFVK